LSVCAINTIVIDRWTHVACIRCYHRTRSADDVGRTELMEIDSCHKLGIERVHVLAHILRLRYVARTPPDAPVEARSPSRRSNVENAPRRRPVIGEPATPTSHIRRAILRTPPSPASHRPAALAEPAQPAVRTMSSYRGTDASL